MSLPQPQPRSRSRPTRPGHLPFDRLAAREWVAALGVLNALVILALFLAPGLDPSAARTSPDPVPSPGGQAPWVFAAIQLLLRVLPPWLAGVALPVLGVLILAALPRLERWLGRDAAWVGLGLVGLAAVLTLAAAAGFLG